MPIQHTAIFNGCRNCNLRMKNCIIFLIFAQNIDRGYQLELPHWENKKIMYTPVNTSISLNGVYITRTGYPDEEHVRSLYTCKHNLLYTVLFMQGISDKKKLFTKIMC